MLKLSQSSLEWALKHVLKYGDTDVFPIPFEYQAIESDWNDIAKFLLSQDLDKWVTRPARSMLAPKAKYGFRIITQIDPIDFLVFSSLVYEIGADLENKRLPKKSQMVFSYRFKPDSNGQLYDPDVGYENFRTRCRTLIKSEQVQYVAVTDIADFYPRLYSHRLENALSSNTNKSDHIRVLRKMLTGWNETESHGIPVGSAPTRLLAEVALNDVDQALVSNKIKFIRFNDDYRIFAKSQEQAFRYLAFLAQVLYDNHGLTLQPQKTSIYNKANFDAIFLQSPTDAELDQVHSQFRSMLDHIGLIDTYAHIDFEHLSQTDKDAVRSIDFVAILEHELSKPVEPDIGILRFVLRRLIQLADDSAVDLLLEKMESIHPVISDVINYFISLKNLNKAKRTQMGARVLWLLKSSMVRDISYHRMWALHLFTQSSDWNHRAVFPAMIESNSDGFSRRELILALGRAHHTFWFQQRWRHLFDEAVWNRRAFLMAASCLPKDARKHWYDSVAPKCELIERSVIKWARVNPF